MEETTFLILLSIVMLCGSYLAGSIPLVMTMSEAKLQLVSVFGAGLLVGTALSVIIPEGIRSLVDSLPKLSVVNEGDKGDALIGGHAFEEAVEGVHQAIGLTLVLGFVLMLLIDQLSSNLGRDIEGGITGGKPKYTATLGLVVHSAVDGVALGAAASTTHTSVEMIVFLAIMLHKAPAAFGLVSFLMHEGLDRKKIKRHLIVFSLAAPLMSLATYFCIGQEGKEQLSTMHATGIAMLFSAGTFLYVATVHVLPELSMRAGGSFRPKQLILLVVGILLPLVLASGHHH